MAMHWEALARVAIRNLELFVDRYQPLDQYQEQQILLAEELGRQQRQSGDDRPQTLTGIETPRKRKAKDRDLE